MKNLTYTISIIIAVTIAYIFPDYFTSIGDFKMSKLILPLLQIIMFGVGATLTFADFTAVIKTPKKIIVGMLCQFTIMPFVGFAIAKSFNFPPEIAAGLILIGSCPSGLASNVMCVIANANVALSVTLTTCATLVAPFITPLLMKYLGGSFVDIDALKMFWDINKTIILPIIGGFMLNYFLPKFAKSIHSILPYLSMVGIALILMIIIASGQKSLQQVGFLLIIAVFIHNTVGYLLGFYSAKVLGFEEVDCRTIALEVGMQNGGLGTSLANELGKAATMGLAPAIFGSMMNVTASILAAFWKNKKPKESVEGQ
ncbi:MAG: bile acid:sodium symporter family protein [Saprospiraceae bacterium]|nr:bile acid:sodium symporter family protein [Saprospiraceae bacterium]